MSDKHCESCKCKCEEKKVESLPTVVEEVKKPKAKRVLSDAQKAVLAKGREKRLELLKSKKGAVETKEEVKEETKKEEVKEEEKEKVYEGFCELLRYHDDLYCDYGNRLIDYIKSVIDGATQDPTIGLSIL